MSPGYNSSSSNNSNPRQVVIDDDDHAVHYKGPWSKSNGKSITFNHKSLQIVPYDNTLHGTQGDGKFAFTFSFNGEPFDSYSFDKSKVNEGTTTGNVMGFADFSNSSGVLDPTWECVLDGRGIKANDPPDSPTDQFSFCGWETKDTGPHNITVKVKSKGSQFFFDQITFVPDPHFPVKNATVLVGKQDDALMFRKGIVSTESMKPGSRMAMSDIGSVITFPFFGSSLSWYGKVKDGRNLTGYYSIDGQPPQNFTVKPPSSSGQSKSKTPVLFFHTPHKLSIGNHTISVTGTGDPQSSGLPLSYLVLGNAHLPSSEILLDQPDPSNEPPSISGLPNGPVPSPTSSYSYHRPPYGDGDDGQANDSKSDKRFPYTSIISALGGILFLVFMAGLILCMYRRRRRNRIESPESATPVVPTPTGSSSASAPPPYTPPQNMFQMPSPDYPFAQGSSFGNFAKRFTSSIPTSTRPNSLFASFRPLSPLPTKRMSFASSAGSSTHTFRPYISRPRSNTRSSTGSTATLLTNESISERRSEPPSHKGSLRFSFADDQTVVEEEVEPKEGYDGMWHARPPADKHG